MKPKFQFIPPVAIQSPEAVLFFFFIEKRCHSHPSDVEGESIVSDYTTKLPKWLEFPIGYQHQGNAASERHSIIQTIYVWISFL
jgi:hypothetical protein